jgi:signal transduction histidine kinase
MIILFSLTKFVEAAITVPIYLGGFFFFVTFANATHQANEARAESQRLLDELQTTHRKLQEYAAQAEQLAVAEERNRLSREMHDTIGHRLTVAAVQLEGAQKLISKDPNKAEQMAGTVREQVREALNELRQTVATLREPLESDLPLAVSLKRLVDGFEEATGITIHLLLPESFPEMSAEHRLAIYRTAQEALTNVQKHAEAQQVWLQVSRQEDILTLRVSDNGKGMMERKEAAGFGLRGIQERAAQLGGEFRLEARKGGGAQVCLSLPVAVKT